MTPPADASRRFAEVDAVKAVGILTVVGIHSLAPIWAPDAPAHAVWWAHVTRFAVPGFLAASGYLYASARPLPRRVTSRRLTRIFLRGPDGRRPVHGDAARFRDDPQWRDLLLFYEYFHGDTGAGIGASHQTGWTGLVAKLLQQSGE